MVNSKEFVWEKVYYLVLHLPFLPLYYELLQNCITSWIKLIVYKCKK
jgi:hypothetical protein